MRPALLCASVAGLFVAYTLGAQFNPPGFYVDESALSFNAYLVSQTGAGETGEKFPLFFPVYTEPFTQYANPTQVYLLALLIKITGPSILAARLLAAGFVFLACVLLGLLARRIAGSDAIGLIAGGLALTTPWLFEIGRVVLETFCYPLAVVLLLWSVFRASCRKIWGRLDCLIIVLSLALVTYSYTIGRLLGPLLAAGLVILITDRKRLVSVLAVWAMYAASLVPFLVYWYRSPDLSARFRTISYLRPGSSTADIALKFVSRFLEDINPLTMLFVGDVNPRHHLPGVVGSFLIGTFILSLTGIAVVVVGYRRERWWLYVVFGLLASAVPGALTVDVFHTLRMAAYPVFLLILTVPALDWFLGEARRDGVSPLLALRTVRLPIAGAILGLAAAQAGFFFFKYHTTGTDRGEYFDAGYARLYERAVGQADRPIYLVDGYWGPMYIHAFWYATREGRGLDGFVHLAYGERPEAAGALVLSSEKTCSGCTIIQREGGFILYKTLGADGAQVQSETR